MNEQLSMIEPPAAAPVPGAPRCRLCVRPARWLTNRQQWGMYCNGYNCNNRDRLCQNCDEPFHMGVDRAGTKYCGTCKTTGRPDRPRAGVYNCAWCGKLGEPSRRGTNYEDRAWPYICRPCLNPIRHVVDRLKAHHVPPERARQLRDDPTCEICGTDILAKVRESGHGKIRALLVVDHDHTCCPADSHSCGRCVRGLLCRMCNFAAGALRDNPKTARALGDYLEAWTNR